MPELHSIDVQHNNLFIDNIMLHWELGQKPNDWSVQLGVRIAHGWTCWITMACDNQRCQKKIKEIEAWSDTQII